MISYLFSTRRDRRLFLLSLPVFDLIAVGYQLNWWSLNEMRGEQINSDDKLSVIVNFIVAFKNIGQKVGIKYMEM